MLMPEKLWGQDLTPASCAALRREVARARPDPGFPRGGHALGGDKALRCSAPEKLRGQDLTPASLQQASPVFIILEDRFAAVAARCDVIQAARQFDAQGTGHAPRIGSDAEGSDEPKRGGFEGTEEAFGTIGLVVLTSGKVRARPDSGFRSCGGKT